ncbi:GvpL/GvpF family gas vesicle protein [Streptomyces sp. NPDC059740]|uniref:GvpL/GvpF family gas vesicle protein n=1 Tax=Streptomyces sp. NPDC059740 TaxID=3346926 RepID=UPI00364CD8BD
MTERTTPAPPAAGAPDTSRYLYAVGPAGEALDAAAAQVPGLFGEPLHVVTADGLGALVSAVPARDFDEAGLRRQLEDMERLELLARGHDAVVAGAGRHATVLPMRLATVYLDDTRVAEMLRARAEVFHGLLRRLEGHREWGVKVYAHAPAEQDPAPEPAVGGDTSPGRSYLRRRRAQRNGRRDIHRAAGTVAARVPQAAEGLAVGRVAHRPQQGPAASGSAPAGPGGAAENVCNEAYLVPDDRIEEFRARMAGLAEGVEGVSVQVTGPWAPYSFATPPEPGPADAS